MFSIPLDELKSKIREHAGLTAEELEAKLKEKMEQLSGLVSEEGACHIIANELQVELTPPEGERKVKDLLPGMRDVQQDMRVLQVYELRTFTTKAGAEGKVASFLAGDATGKLRVTCWGARADDVPRLKPEDTVRVVHGYIRENNGRPELHLNDKAELHVNPEGVTVAMPAATTETADVSYPRKKISELSKGDYRVELLGTVVQVYDPRFFERKDGRKGTVANMLIDDGTGNIRCGCFDDQAAAVLQLPLDTMMQRAGETFEEEKTNALGMIVKVTGRVKLNTLYNSLELTADSVDMKPDPQQELADGSLVASEPAAPVEKVEAPKPAEAAPVVENPTVEKKPASENLFDDADDDLPSLDDLEDLNLDDL